jgi:2-iminoacetate synthase
MPYAGIVVSSRESAAFRNNIVKIAATKISAGVCVGIGGHLEDDGSEKGDEQFEITDNRSFDEIYSAIASEGLQPVTSEYIYL